ncbi:hypothetical protein M885DRAFT_590465 [Pelagophyceae sp. CCMP2097]|nr:hypothetical protein M885DRAFT_590465 [Pelagophyceae sp. CCMP2097]
MQVSEPSFAVSGGAVLEARVAQFSELAVKDWLQKKGYERTLAALESDFAASGRAAPSADAWYATAQLLDLPRLLQASKGLDTIVEVCVKELVRETSIRMRRPVTLTFTQKDRRAATATGATAASAATSPNGWAAGWANAGFSAACAEAAGSAADADGAAVKVAKARTLKFGLPLEATAAFADPRPAPLFHVSLGKQLTLGSSSRSKLPSTKLSVVHPSVRASLSREHWIPMDLRERMLERSLSATKANVELLEARNKFVHTEHSHHTLSELEQSLAEERFGLRHRKRCGLCDLEYSKINLVLAVPLKAIVDLRERWTSEMEPDAMHVAAARRQRKTAAAYDEIFVCALCAQFFRLGQQEIYRPSYEKKPAAASNSETRTPSIPQIPASSPKKTCRFRSLERSAKLQAQQDAEALAYWDPVKQLEATRAKQMAEQGDAYIASI